MRALAAPSLHTGLPTCEFKQACAREACTRLCSDLLLPLCCLSHTLMHDCSCCSNQKQGACELVTLNHCFMTDEDNFANIHLSPSPPNFQAQCNISTKNRQISRTQSQTSIQQRRNTAWQTARLPGPAYGSPILAAQAGLSLVIPYFCGRLLLQPVAELLSSTRLPGAACRSPAMLPMVTRLPSPPPLPP